MFNYRCKVIKVVDGDTVDVDIDLGFGIWMKDERVRLYGIDTPESRTSDKEEKLYGLAAKEFLANMCDDEWMILECNKYDSKGKFGRILGSLRRTTNYADQTVNEYLIEKYHAVPYYGQSKDDIAAAHLRNRELVNLNG
jgi:micrococcal nuclease